MYVGERFMKILIVEDEKSISDAICTRLKKEKYTVDIALDGEEGLYDVLLNIYDLVILDVMLPYVNGFEILKKMREDNINSKVIMLTAKSTLEDKLSGLLGGASDYVTKPFHMDELVARVNILLKGTNNNKSIITFEDINLDIVHSSLENKNNNKKVELVKKELLLLEYFINNPNIILSKDQIINKIWGLDNSFESNNLEVYLSFIRRKLKAIESCVNIKAVRGLGYKMEFNYEEIKK